MPKNWISLSEEQNILEGFGLRSGVDLIWQHLLPQGPSEVRLLPTVLPAANP
jgi:hypothetical protein